MLDEHLGLDVKTAKKGDYLETLQGVSHPRNVSQSANTNDLTTYESVSMGI